MTVTRVEVPAAITGSDKPQTVPQGGATAVPPSSSVEASPGERPSWLPEKFKTPEDMAKAYGELEKQRSPAKPAEAPALTGTNTPGQVSQVVSADELQAYSTEYAKEGKLSEATMAALEAKGIGKAVVDQYVQGQIALAKAHQTAVFGIAGGENEYIEVLGWANKNLTPEEAKAADVILQSGDFNSIKTVVSGLMARRDQAEGKLPGNQVLGQQLGGSGVKPFANLREQSMAQRDPRYKDSQTYRDEVEARISASAY